MPVWGWRKQIKTRHNQTLWRSGTAWNFMDQQWFLWLIGTAALFNPVFASGSSQVTEQEALTEVSYCGSRNCHDRPAITRQSPSCGVSWTLLLLKSNSIFDIFYHPRVRPWGWSSSEQDRVRRKAKDKSAEQITIAYSNLPARNHFWNPGDLDKNPSMFCISIYLECVSVFAEFCWYYLYIFVLSIYWYMYTAFIVWCFSASEAVRNDQLDRMEWMLSSLWAWEP